MLLLKVLQKTNYLFLTLYLLEGTCNVLWVHVIGCWYKLTSVKRRNVPCENHTKRGYHHANLHHTDRHYVPARKRSTRIQPLARETESGHSPGMDKKNKKATVLVSLPLESDSDVRIECPQII